MDASLQILGDTFIVTCPHYQRTDVRTHDPTVPEDDEFMIRYTLQRHSSVCEKACTLPIWMEWFEKRRQRFIREQNNANAHG